jgi:VanZ family protein
VLTVLAGTIFAIAMTIWQGSLPTRVTGPVDTVANTLGVLTGAMAGHLRKGVRVQFDD